MLTRAIHRSLLGCLTALGAVLLIGTATAQDLALRARRHAGDAAVWPAAAPPAAAHRLDYRVPERYSSYAEVSRGVEGDPWAARVPARIGVGWKPAQTSLGFERGAFGMQLDSGARLSLSTRHGGMVLYLRHRF